MTIGGGYFETILKDAGHARAPVGGARPCAAQSGSAVPAGPGALVRCTAGLLGSGGSVQDRDRLQRPRRARGGDGGRVREKVRVGDKVDQRAEFVRPVAVLLNEPQEVDTISYLGRAELRSIAFMQSQHHLSTK